MEDQIDNAVEAMEQRDIDRANAWEVITDRYGDLTAMTDVFNELIDRGGMPAVQDYIDNNLEVVIALGQSEVLLDIYNEDGFLKATGSRGNAYVRYEDHASGEDNEDWQLI